MDGEAKVKPRDTMSTDGRKGSGQASGFTVPIAPSDFAIVVLNTFKIFRKRTERYDLE